MIIYIFFLVSGILSVVLEVNTEEETEIISRMDNSLTNNHCDIKSNDHLVRFWIAPYSKW